MQPSSFSTPFSLHFLPLVSVYTYLRILIFNVHNNKVCAQWNSAAVCVTQIRSCFTVSRGQQDICCFPIWNQPPENSGWKLLSVSHTSSGPLLLGSAVVRVPILLGLLLSRDSETSTAQFPTKNFTVKIRKIKCKQEISIISIILEKGLRMFSASSFYARIPPASSISPSDQKGKNKGTSLPL